MRRILFVMVLATVSAGVGCKKKSEGTAAGAGAPLTCGAAIDKAIDEMIASRQRMVTEREKAGQPVPPGMLAGVTEVANKLRTVMTTRCDADKWSEPVITCFAGASDQPSIKKCREGLPPELAQRLQADIMKVMSGAAGGPGMGHGGPGGPGPGGHGGPMGGPGGPGGPSGAPAAGSADGSAATP